MAILFDDESKCNITTQYGLDAGTVELCHAALQGVQLPRDVGGHNLFQAWRIVPVLALGQQSDQSPSGCGEALRREGLGAYEIQVAASDQAA